MITSEIINIFSKELGKELTINQISKELKKSYGSINGYIHELVKLNIINAKPIGSSILCSLNYSTETTIAYLVFNSINNAIGKKIPNKDSKIIMQINNKTYFLNEITVEKFVKKGLNKFNILKGHEIFWRKVSKVIQ